MTQTPTTPRQPIVGKLLSIAVVVALVTGACAAGVDPSPTDAPTLNPTLLPTEGSTSSPAPSAATPQRTPRFTPFPTLVSAELFDGSFYGWRFAPDDVLADEGLDRNLSLDCEAREYGSEHQTDLDFQAEYLPEGLLVREVVKWACGDLGLSVVEDLQFDSFPGSWLSLQRLLTGSKSADLSAPTDFVRACEVAGRPAVCVHYIDDATGRGGHPGQIFVIEDGSLDPHAVVFRVVGTEIPFAELMKIMETVVGD